MFLGARQEKAFEYIKQLFTSIHSTNDNLPLMGKVGFHVLEGKNT